jgi:hypothetical protein
MKKIILYQVLMLALIATGLLMLYTDRLWPELETYELLITCIMLGGLGGLVYCLRGVYLNACVKGQWSPQWEPWYYIRPIVSLVCGGVSYLFLKAGLLLLEASSMETSSNLGFMALAFIAGLNVDKFISKIEEIAQASWGIDKSRASKGE